MSADALLLELAAAGVRLARDDADLLAEVRPRARLDPYRERIRRHKPALVIALLQAEIVAAATVAPAAFDRRHYDDLWARWHALTDQEHQP